MRTKARYTPQQLEELTTIGESINIATGADRVRLGKQLKHRKYKMRKENWCLFIRDTIRTQSHWRLNKAMTKNNSILKKREIKNNTIEDRRAKVKMWTDHLTNLYAGREIPPFPPDHPIHNINISELEASAADLNFNVEEVKAGLMKAKTGKCAGLNNISTKLLRH